MDNSRGGLWRDISIVFLSFLIATVLVKSGVIDSLLNITQTAWLIGSFAAGIFFTSIFTSIPATVALIEITTNHPPFWVAFFGGLGALFGDLVIFRFVRGSVLTDLLYHNFQSPEPWRITRIFKPRPFRWIIPVLGAIIVASPFPDEIGLAMMGLSKMQTRIFIPLSFLLNFAGILVIGLIAKSV